jgi:hypothetical protein
LELNCEKIAGRYITSDWWNVISKQEPLYSGTLQNLQLWPGSVHFCLQYLPHTALLGTFLIPDQLQLFIPKPMQKMLYFAFLFWFRVFYVRKALKRAHFRRYNCFGLLDFMYCIVQYNWASLLLPQSFSPYFPNSTILTYQLY